MLHERMMAVRGAHSRRSLRVGRLPNQNEPKPKREESPQHAALDEPNTRGEQRDAPVRLSALSSRPRPGPKQNLAQRNWRQHERTTRPETRSSSRPRGATRPMDEDVDWRVEMLGPLDVEYLNGGGAIGVALRCAQPRPHGFAVSGPAFDDLLQVRRIDALIIGGVELRLVHVQPHPRSLDARRWCRLLREPSSGCHYHGASGTSAEKRASRHVIARHGFVGTHRLSPFGVVASIAMTPNARGERRAERVLSTVRFGARLASRSAHHTEAFSRNPKDAIRVSVLIHLLSDCLPDCPALHRRRLRQHGPDARGGGRTLRNELYDRA